MPVPRYFDLFNPVLEAIKRLGGSASIAELDEEVTKSLNLTSEEVAQPHNERMTELEYRLAWARSYLKAYGLLDNSARGVWVLTPKGRDTDSVDPLQVVQFWRNLSKSKKGRGNKTSNKSLKAVVDAEAVEIAETVLEEKWREELLERLLKLSSAAFERLSQRLLRESGFVEVKVSGRSGDGGIDGVGIIRLGGLLGFPVLFQCKRYQGSVGPGIVRDFRGAMIGRADRGLIITTHCLTKNLLLDSSPNHLHLKWFLTLQQDHLLAYVPLQYVRKLLVCLH